PWVWHCQGFVTGRSRAPQREPNHQGKNAHASRQRKAYAERPFAALSSNVYARLNQRRIPLTNSARRERRQKRRVAHSCVSCGTLTFVNLGARSLVDGAGQPGKGGDEHLLGAGPTLTHQSARAPVLV